ncbi:winged helix-turn-helix transcriptional regulator [Candidatus Woesearchaeota archaeon]|nr:winged helix-turn-helix transcriptional regulator [Candidatus Woesearchaeota archaeon]
MRWGYLWLLLIAAFLFIPLSEAATIKGSVYDLDLTIVKNVMVEISTSPHQRFLARDGMYAFEVPPGTYTITARYEDDGDKTGVTAYYRSRDVITVEADGTYLFDLFLHPDIEEDEEVLEDISLTVDNGLLEEEKTPIIMYGALIAVFLIALLVFLKLIWKKYGKGGKEKPSGTAEASTAMDEQPLGAGQATAGQNNGAAPIKEQEPEPYGQQILDILQKNERRMTQKDIRKELPLSEAKVSLLITELEHAGKIKKIKKGRGNIVILT